MENISGSNAPIFDARYLFQLPHLVFIPSFDEGSEHGLLARFEQFMQDTFSISYVIPRIAQSNETERIDENGQPYVDSYLCKSINDVIKSNIMTHIKLSFTDLLETNVNIERMKNDIITNVKMTMKEAQKYYKQFNKYEHLWLTDKEAYLNEFLTYGRLLTTKERDKFLTNDPPNIRQHSPDMAAFSDQVKLVCKYIYLFYSKTLNIKFSRSTNTQI